MFNKRLIIKTLGLLLVFEGFFMLLSACVSLGYSEAAALPMMLAAATCVIIGGTATRLTKDAEKKISKKDGFVIVSFTWIIISFFGCLPYIFSGSISSLTNAFFETMAGFSTTGASILNDIESLPKGILFWRSLTQWLGGMGIIVLSLAVMPVFGIGGMQLFAAEFSGPAPDKVTPRINQTAKRLWFLYSGLTLAETILLWCGGMNLFDAVNHSLTTMSSGGFSTKQESIAFWDSPFIHYVIIFFMILSGTNFALSYGAITGKLHKLRDNEEFRFYILLIIIFTIIIFTGLAVSTQGGAEKAFRTSLFQVVSIITTTGFVTTDYLAWAPFLTAVLFALFFFGGSTGSTSGGTKIMRIVLLFKNSYYEFSRMLHPNAIVPIRFNKRAVSGTIIHNVMAFFIIYFIIFFVSTVLFSLLEPNLETAMGAVASCLGNIGPGLGHHGPVDNYLNLHPMGKWFLSFLMLLGRLELFTILVLLAPAFWKK